MTKPCRHCGSPARENPCWWFIKHPSYARSGEDPPCVLEDYETEQAERTRHAMTVLFLFIALVFALSLWLVSCGDSKPPAPPPAPTTISMLPSAWQARYSSDVNIVAAAQGWAFAFPVKPNSVHYVVAPVNMALADRVEATFSIGGVDPVFEYTPEPTNVCGGPATVRLFIQQQNDDGVAAYGRWWSIAGTTLAIGNFAISMSLRGDLWSSVYGEKGNASTAAAAGFVNAIRKVGAIGVTFGGGCFYGHGDDLIDGSATFNMQAFSAQ